MRLSVVVPVLDEAARLPAALSALRDRVGEAEVVVVDGGSTDASAEIARDHGADLVLAAGGGRGGQLRAGAARAGGDVLLFLHADCVLPENTRARIAETMGDGRWVAGAFRVRHRVSAGAGPVVRRLVRLADLRSGLTRRPYGDQALFVRREVYARVGGFPDQPLLEDLELARRLTRVGRLRVLRERVEVSGRRFERRPLRSVLCWWTFPLLYRLGVSPMRLERWYGHAR